MKAVTNEWLDHAWRDLEAATRLVTTEYLTGIAVFHAQQAVEKSLKAIIEEFEIWHIKTHDLQRLHAMTESWLDLDQTSLDILNTVYIDARSRRNSAFCRTACRQHRKQTNCCDSLKKHTHASATSLNAMDWKKTAGNDG